MLEFDAETTAMLEEAYQGGDFRRRRRLSFDALDPRPGDHLLDLGCGQGLLTLELARAVGGDGHVTGIDPSPDMLTAARNLCGDRENVSLREGSALAPPVSPGTLDGCVALQVFEYIDDLAGALRATGDLLRPGGRLVVSDMQFSTLSWASDDPERMARVMGAYDNHLAHRDTPELLPPLMRDAGLTRIRSEAHVFADTVLRPDGLATMMISLISGFVIGGGFLPEETVRDWAAEQYARGADGRFFFALTHFVTTATRPG